jgi:hypothetical protein
MVIPYFGRWPVWMPFFIASCRANPTIDWLLFSDCGKPEDCPDNVRIVETCYEDYCALVARRLGIDFRPGNPYKLCDIKPALGYIHADRLENYDFWAFGDIDVVYGKLRDFYTTARLARYDLISSHARRISGHLTTVRNTPRMREAFQRIPNWQQRFCGPHEALDEGAFSRIFLWRKNFPKPLFKFVGLFNPWRRKSDFREDYSTPNAGLAWIDGSKNFPTDWFWREGHLTNDRDHGREFPYLHFMIWKETWKNNFPVTFAADYARLARATAWRISATGFDAIDASQAGNIHE